MELQIFKKEEFGQVRVIEIENKAWFVGKDVALILGYSEPHKAIKRHIDEEDRMKHPIPTKGGIQNSWLINESGIYALVLSSKLSSAKSFKRWITAHVVPAIRRHGAYIAPEKIEDVLLNPDTIIQLATNLKAEKEKRLQFEKKIELNKPKVLFAEAVESSEDTILIKEMALILTQQGFEIGQNQLFEYLRMYGYLCRKIGDMYNLPTKKYEHLFKVVKRTVQHTDRTSVRNTPKINGKGQLYFIQKFSEYKLNGLTIKDLLMKDVVAN